MIKRFLLTLLMGALLAFLPAHESVSYAGFCFGGNYSDIEHNYPYCHSLSIGETAGQNSVEKLFYDFFSSSPHFYNFNIDMHNRSSSGSSLAITVTRENVDKEIILGKTKLIYNLAFNLYILDFSQMTVVQSYPFRVSFIELYQQMPEESQIRAQILSLIQNQLLNSIKSKQMQIAIRSSSSLAMKVANVEISNESAAILAAYQQNQDSYKAILANQLTNSFAFGLNIAMLPYAKDYAGQKMALSFSDARILSFEIPQAAYDIDLRLDKFHKALYKESASERVDIYGAYITVKIYDAELCTQYWNQQIKYGATKQSIKNQSLDDFANYNEVLLKTIDSELIATIKKDKKLTENSRKKKGVITRCANY